MRNQPTAAELGAAEQILLDDSVMIDDVTVRTIRKVAVYIHAAHQTEREAADDLRQQLFESAYEYHISTSSLNGKPTDLFGHSGNFDNCKNGSCIEKRNVLAAFRAATK